MDGIPTRGEWGPGTTLPLWFCNRSVSPRANSESRMRLAYALVAFVFTSPGISAADCIDIKIAPTMKEYCHIIRFPDGWKVQGGPGSVSNYEYYDQFEFRASSLPMTRFLVGGVLSIEKRYTINKYDVDLSDAKAPVSSATDQAWDSASRVSTKQRSAVVRPDLPQPTQALEYHGTQFTKTGAFWSVEGGRLSPDGAWLVLQSWTGSAESGFRHRRVRKVFSLWLPRQDLSGHLQRRHGKEGARHRRDLFRA